MRATKNENSTNNLKLTNKQTKPFTRQNKQAKIYVYLEITLLNIIIKKKIFIIGEWIKICINFMYDFIMALIKRVCESSISRMYTRVVHI